MANATTVGSAMATTTYNIDVHSIVRRYNRIIKEVSRSQSSGVSQLMPFDLTRIKAYLVEMNGFLDYSVAEPLLDCPETGPQEIPLPTPEALPRLENDSAYDIMQLLQVARDEMANSQASRMSTSIGQYDYARQKSYLAKVGSLMAYIASAEPLDLPESSPMTPMTGAGNVGI